MKIIRAYLFQLLKISLLSLLLAGCSGSSAEPTTAISGSVFAGPAAGSSVSVKNSAGTIVAGPVTTAGDGSFTIAIPTSALSSDLIFEANGGTFPDEASATSGVTLGALSSHATGGTLTAGANVTIDPGSTIIQKLVAGGKTRSAAETLFNGAFGYTHDATVTPTFANISSVATTAQRLCGLRAAAFSQLTKDLGLTPARQFELIQALADDLSDGVLDGKKSGVPVTTASGTPLPEDIGNRFANALVSFQNSTLNKSKLTPDKIGAPPFVKTALSTSYKVEYLPGDMAAAQGKTSFRIRLTNRSDGTAASGKTVTLRPYMYMATKSHTTPADPVVDNGDGSYSCTVYYVMSTAMNGVSMGVWELKVTIGTESVIFYPNVAMPMGNTPLAKLFGSNDSIAGMAGVEARTYFLFNDGLSSGMGGSYSFKLFLATKEMMTSFPAVKVGSQLKDKNGTLWTVNTITVEASTDKINWIAATDNGNGHWSVTGLTGLTSGVAGKIYVRLTVNGEQKTTDGSAAAGTNGYQEFTVTPSSM